RGHTCSGRSALRCALKCTPPGSSFIRLSRVPGSVYLVFIGARPFGASLSLGRSSSLTSPVLECLLGELHAAEVADPFDGAMGCPGTGGAQLGHQPARAVEAGVVAFVIPPPAMKGTHHVGAGDLGTP